MTDSVARCTSCNAHDVHRVTASSAFFHEGRLVAVRDIPALECRSCGEQYYDDATIVALDLLRGRGFDPAEACGEITIPVFSLAGTVDEYEREMQAVP